MVKLTPSTARIVTYSRTKRFWTAPRTPSRRLKERNSFARLGTSMRGDISAVKRAACGKPRKGDSSRCIAPRGAREGAGNDFFPQALRLCVKDFGEPRNGILFSRRNFSIRILVSTSSAFRVGNSRGEFSETGLLPQREKCSMKKLFGLVLPVVLAVAALAV